MRLSLFFHQQTVTQTLLLYNRTTLNAAKTSENQGNRNLMLPVIAGVSTGQRQLSRDPGTSLCPHFSNLHKFLTGRAGNT